MALLPHYEEGDQQKKLWEIIKVAQRISPRVDDVVTSMYPPLDPRLLESRCLSLVLSVTQLAMVIRYLCHIKSSWLDDAICELEQQVKVSFELEHFVRFVLTRMPLHRNCERREWLYLRPHRFQAASRTWPAARLSLKGPHLQFLKTAQRIKSPATRHSFFFML